jgi:hypothetical protein
MAASASAPGWGPAGAPLASCRSWASSRATAGSMAGGGPWSGGSSTPTNEGIGCSCVVVTRGRHRVCQNIGSWGIARLLSDPAGSAAAATATGLIAGRAAGRWCIPAASRPSAAPVTMQTRLTASPTCHRPWARKATVAGVGAVEGAGVMVVPPPDQSRRVRLGSEPQPNDGWQVIGQKKPVAHRARTAGRHLPRDLTGLSGEPSRPDEGAARGRGHVRRGRRAL